MSNSVSGLKLLDYLFEKPVVNIREAERFMGVSYVTAASVIGNLEQAGLLKEITGQKRNKIFRYEPYIDLFNKQAIYFPHGSDETGPEMKTGSPDSSSQA